MSEGITSGMMCMTIRQPWAWAIRPGGKDVENRGPGLSWIKPGTWLGVHAGKGWSHRGQIDGRIRDLADQPGFGRGAVRLALEQDVRKAGPPPPPFEFSALVAFAIVDDVHPGQSCDDDRCRPWGESVYIKADGTKQAEVCHIVLADVMALRRPLDGITGRLGAWEPREDLRARMVDVAIAENWVGLRR
jgi:hypothetical protein